MHDRSRLLIATTRRWFSAARLAIALTRAGFDVEAICPADHPLHVISVVRRVYPLRSMRPARSLEDAIAASRPALIVPCDDLAAIQLRLLHKALLARPRVHDHAACIALLERSLGDPSSYPVLESRAEFLALVAEQGMATPKTADVASVAAVREWCETNGLPAVLKADGTWSGEGVCAVRTVGEAVRAFRRLRAPIAAMTVLKRASLDRDHSLILPSLKRSRRNVSIQAFVAGGECNIAFAAWKGQVLASVSAEVLQTWNKQGPASMIRILPDGEMLRVAKIAAASLKLCGLFGLDFIVDEQTGQPLLIEINPRATQTCHLPLGPGHDLMAALFTAVTGRPGIPVAPITSREVALFPLAWQSQPAHEAFGTAHHDIPLEEPALVRKGEAEIRSQARNRRGRLWMKRVLSGT